MADPVTLTVGAIAALAFTKFLESSAEHAAEKLTPAVLEKMNALRQKIWQKLRNVPEVDELNKVVEAGKTVTKQEVDTLLTPHLEAAMKDDPAFDREVRNLAQQIQQEININQGSGSEVWNVIGHAEKNEFIDNKAPVIKDNTGTVNINYGHPSV